MRMRQQEKGRYGPRFRLKFAWFPVLMETGELVWLEKFYVRWFERGTCYDWEPERRLPGDSWVEEVGVLT